MIRMIMATALALLLVGCKADDPQASSETSPGGIAYSRLYLPDAKDVAIQIAWSTDWVSRDDVNQAVPYIGADLMLSGGAEGYPAGQAVEDFADLQAQASLSVTPDNILGSLMVPKENLDKAVKIANAHLRAPLLDDKWLIRIRDGFAARMAESSGRPESRGFAALRWAAFGDAPIRAALSLDQPGMVESVTRDDVALWRSTVLSRANAKLVIAGALDAAEAGRIVDALLEGLPEGTPVPALSIRASLKPKRILLHIPDAQTSTLAFIAPLPPAAEGGEMEDLILIRALGSGENSVLFDAVRTQLRAAYGFGAGLDGFTRANRLLVLRGQVDADKLAQTEEVVRAAYSAFRSEGPMGALADLKASLAERIQIKTNDPASSAFSALMAVLDGQSPQMAFDLKQVLDAVSEASLKARLQHLYPAPEDFVVLAVSPNADALPGACVITEPEQAKVCE